jgi:hypothetical protein
LLRVGSDDLGVGTIPRVTGFQLVEGFAHSPRERLLAPPEVRFVASIL